jgi:hypothetical protein
VFYVRAVVYTTTVSPLLLYGSETWSLTLREEPGLRAFEKRMLRRIFGPKREWGVWVELHSEKLHDLYASPNTV